MSQVSRRKEFCTEKSPCSSKEKQGEVILPAIRIESVSGERSPIHLGDACPYIHDVAPLENICSHSVKILEGSFHAVVGVPFPESVMEVAPIDCDFGGFAPTPSAVALPLLEPVHGRDSLVPGDVLPIDPDRCCSHCYNHRSLGSHSLGSRSQDCHTLGYRSHCYTHHNPHNRHSGRTVGLTPRSQ